jgi:gliding motility-associated-like protein
MPFTLGRRLRRYLLFIIMMITTCGVFIHAQTPLVTGDINKYTRVTAVGSNYVDVSDVSDFSVGDTVMVIQMNGVRINAGTTSDLRGTYQNVVGEPGAYEILLVASINTLSGRVTFSRVLLNTYDAAASVQLIKVRTYRNAVVNSELTVQLWDSASVSGGVLAFMVKGVLTLNDDIDLSGKGFRGGIAAQGNGNCQNLDVTATYESYNIASLMAGYKGEGIAFRTATDLPLYPDYMRGKGANMTGGGGGNGHFSGGGGGANYGAGYVGDIEISPNSCVLPLPGGRGGFSVSPHGTINHGVFMGGGGGASVWLTTPSNAHGGNGGGIVIIHADTIRGNGRLITARGAAAADNVPDDSGAGGGGAGGSVIVSTSHFASAPALDAAGGDGGDNQSTVSQNGAGGGGGGGLIWTNIPFVGSTTVAGGQGGVHNGGDSNADGSPGVVWNDLNLPLNGFLFNEIYVAQNLSALDSVCEGMVPPAMTGTRPAGGSGTYTYQWQKSYDNSIWTNVAGTGREYTPTAAETTSLWFRRVVDDGAGIVDYSMPVRIIVHPRITGNLIAADTTICFNQEPEELYPANSGPAGGTGIYYYTWEQSPDNIAWSDVPGSGTAPAYDPQALTATTWYHRIVSSGACTDVSTPVTVTVLPAISGNSIAADQTICEGTLFSSLTGSTPSGGASSYAYQWMSSSDNLNWVPAAGSSNGINYDPQDDSPGTTWYRRDVFSGPSNTCQSVSNTVQLICHPDITNNTISAPQTICEGAAPAALDGTVPANGAGAGTYLYQWMVSDNGVTFQDITGASGEDLPGTPLTATTWYRRQVTSSVCTSTSNDIEITVDPRITSFTIDLPAQGHDTICTGNTPPQLSGTAAGGLGTFTYAWASSTDNITFTPLAATSPSFQPGALTATTWFRRTVSSGACSESSVIRITVLPQVSGNTLSADQTVCNTQTPSALTGTTPAGGDGTYRYLWEMKPAAAPDWITAAGTHSSKDYQPPLLDGTTQFRRHVYSGEVDCCTSVSLPVTVNVDIMPLNISAGADRELLPYQYAAVLEGSFDGEGVASWSYDFSSGDGNPVFSTPGERVTEVTKLGGGDNTFIFSVVNGQCVADEVSVTLSVPELIIPQGVTPNGDGINDYFNIEGLEYTYNELVIINTGGAVVYRSEDYRSDDPVNAWNGLDLHGNEVPDGTYYYLLKIRGARDAAVPAFVSQFSGFIILRR